MCASSVLQLSTAVTQILALSLIELSRVVRESKFVVAKTPESWVSDFSRVVEPSLALFTHAVLTTQAQPQHRTGMFADFTGNARCDALGYWVAVAAEQGFWPARCSAQGLDQVVVWPNLVQRGEFSTVLRTEPVVRVP
jgi:hypothetical protein